MSEEKKLYRSDCQLAIERKRYMKTTKKKHVKSYIFQLRLDEHVSATETYVSLHNFISRLATAHIATQNKKKIGVQCKPIHFSLYVTEALMVMESDYTNVNSSHLVYARASIPAANYLADQKTTTQNQIVSKTSVRICIQLK